MGRGILKPFINLGKKYIYNPYLRSKLSFSDFPPEVWIENTNVCNANCVMCPREKLTRKQGFMDFSLYEKLIKEVSMFAPNVKRVHLHNYGEPLLDVNLVYKIKLAKDYGIKHTYFVTNASLLTAEKSRQVIEAGLDEFKVSFYGTDSETYNKTMKGLNFEIAIQNIKNFVKIRKEMGVIKPRVIIQFLPQITNQLKVKEFKIFFSSIIEQQDELVIVNLLNYGNGRDYFNLGKVVNICSYPWRTIVILHNGKVAPCCLDYNGVQVIGDVNKNTIKEIWNGKEFNKLREDFKNLNYERYPICNICDVTRMKQFKDKNLDRGLS